MEKREDEIAERLIKLRKSRKYSQRDLQREFELLGYPISQNLIFKLEHRQKTATDVEICAYMEVFRATSAYILFGHEEPKEEKRRYAGKTQN